MIGHSRAFVAATALLAAAFSLPDDAEAQGPYAPAAQTRARRLMGDIAPKLAELTDGVLFGDVWERPQLSKRDRSLVTVSALIALARPDQLRSHLALARENGLSEEELVETITHLAFYSGWPNATQWPLPGKFSASRGIEGLISPPCGTRLLSQNRDARLGNNRLRPR